ncbi:MAG: sialate O-acetylesterase [Bryobacteraceae bacterium]
MNFRHRRVWLAALVCAAGGLRAEVTLPYILADHMVVQRNLPVHVWGKAAPGEHVSVAFRGHRAGAVAGRLGAWSVYLPPGPAGGPFELAVSGSNAITLRDVLVGDVWIASGQSNMEWPLAWAANASAEIAAANHPGIRLVRAMHKVSAYPLDNLVGQMWAPCTPESAKNFSAAGYHFGRLLHERLGVPLGLVQSAWGGTPAEAWTSLPALSADPALAPVFAEWPQVQRRFPHWMPGGLYNAMIAPLTKMPIAGVIWYQGEANTSDDRAPYYGRVFETLIRDWRRAWGLGNFPFLFVQLAGFRAPEEAMWPEVREAQRRALSLVNTGMAAAIDIGDPASIHPLDKREVGRRLSLAARALVYGENIEYSGPSLRRVTGEPGALRVWFDHAAGLHAVGGRPRAFEIAGPRGGFVPAEAAVEGETVVLRNPAVPAPSRVRYGWKDDPGCNLYNAAALPAPPFTAP